MAIKATNQWLTVCLYYNEPWEEFLAKAVKPYVNVVMQAGIAECFFFQRSWERGPHIRLWFRGSADVLQTMLKPNLEEHFSHYFDSLPSLLIEPNYPSGFPDDRRWHPNNSVQYFNYEPELNRYAGRLELSLCAKQYQASSTLVMKTLKDKTYNWTYNEMMSAAIKMHLSFAYAAGLSLSEAGDFFHLMFENWRKESLPDDSGASGEASIRSFARIFEMQKKDILPYHSALWELFKNFHAIEDVNFVRWFHENANVSLELSLAIESGKLREKSGCIPIGTLGNPEQECLWNYFSEFVQLTNNRLGIHKKNEGYLFYMLDQSLRLMNTHVPAVYAQLAA